MAFFTDITLGHYYPTNSFLHRLDPRTKLLAVFVIMAALLITQKITVLLLFITLLFFGIYIARLPFALVMKNLRPFIWLFALTVFVHVFFTEGHVIANMPIIGISISEQGLINGVLYSVRLALFIVLAAIFTLTTSPIELTDALEKLFNPFRRFRVPTHEVVMMMTLALRFIPTLVEEAERLRKAQISRGASFEGNVIKRIKSLIPFVLPLFISAFRRADELAKAMDSRCYAGGEGRTSYKMLRFHLRDYGVMAFSIVISVFAVVN